MLEETQIKEAQRSMYVDLLNNMNRLSLSPTEFEDVWMRNYSLINELEEQNKHAHTTKVDGVPFNNDQKLKVLELLSKIEQLTDDCTEQEKYMCEMLLRKMRGEGVEVNVDNVWINSEEYFVNLNYEYRATPERKFVVGESYPCVYDDGEIDVFLCSDIGKFTSTDGYVKIDSKDLKFIGESLGVIKFK